MLGAGSFPYDVTRLTILERARAYPWFTSTTISDVIGLNPLQTTLIELGIVSGRVALLLRSAEIQPSFIRFVNGLLSIPPFPNTCQLLQGALPELSTWYIFKLSTLALKGNTHSL